MSVLSNARAWYAVRTNSRHEQNVANIMEGLGYESLSPTYVARRKWCDRMKDVDLPLFPGYVFGRFDARDKWRIVNLPGVFGIVHFGNVLAPVDDSEIAALRTVVKAGVAREPAERPQVGELVEIVSGPLAGIVGPVVQVRNAVRLVLSVTLLHRSVLVHVSPADIRSLNRAGKTIRFLPTSQVALDPVNLRQ